VPQHNEIRYLPYRTDQMFDLVADIERYPEFLPWCISAKNKKHETINSGEIIWADLVVGFKLLQERFTSKVELSPASNSEPSRIEVKYVDGPLKYLHNNWVFLPEEDGGCKIDFFVEFEFRSKLLESMIGALFHEAVTRMVEAFERRADSLYGSK